MNAAVAKAISEIQAAFPETPTEIQEDGQGGASVILGDIPIGELFTPSSTWIGFRITFQYPYSDVYPPLRSRRSPSQGGCALGAGITSGHNFLGRPSLQLSRRSNHLNPQNRHGTSQASQGDPMAQDLSLKYELVMSDQLWEELRKHLFPGDHDEHGAIMLRAWRRPIHASDFWRGTPFLQLMAWTTSQDSTGTGC